MTNIKSLLILTALAITLTACCCPCGSLLGRANFTAGDFPDVPAYPGATQTTQTNLAINAATSIVTLAAEDSEWKHYTTSDSDSAVLDWYAGELPQHRWVQADTEDIKVQGGLLFVKMDDPSTLLYLFTLADPQGEDKTHIVIGRAILPVEISE